MQSAGQFNFLCPQKNKNDVSLLLITDVRLTDPKGMDLLNASFIYLIVFLMFYIAVCQGLGL